MKEEKMVPAYDGTLLRLRKDTIENPKALIVISHGLCEHLNRYDYFAEKLNENGFSVYRYDQRGHGKSEGKKVFFNDFNEMPDDTDVFINMAREESNGTKVFLFGHSMGGETVALYGTKYPGKTDGIITSDDKGLRIYANLFHEILNEPCKDEIIADIMLWLNKHIEIE